MIRVLHVLPSLSGGGISKVLFEYYKRLVGHISFDFVVSSDKEGVFEKELISMGCNIYHLPKISKDLHGYKKMISNIISQNKYDVVHSHCDFKSYFELSIAKKMGVGVRIAHSHRSNQSISPLDKLIHLIFGMLTKKVATHLFACGKDAAIWAWGKQQYYKKNVFIMHNAINIKDFIFSQTARDSIRKSLGIATNIVIGNVARFCYAKNHEYLIKLFHLMHIKNPSTRLMLVGTGECFDDIKSLVKYYNLDDSVLFMGERKDVGYLLNAMDAFVMPSRFEGLPVSLIEVQTNGLQSYVSNTITDEVKISSGFHFFDLSDDPNKVAELILSSKWNRVFCDVGSFGYDIELESMRLLQKYEQMIG